MVVRGLWPKPQLHAPDYLALALEGGSSRPMYGSVAHDEGHEARLIVDRVTVIEHRRNRVAIRQHRSGVPLIPPNRLVVSHQALHRRAHERAVDDRPARVREL